MSVWNSRGLRGSGLEEAINFTNEKYLQEHLALVQKIPIPITPIEIDKASYHITLAYFEKKSTVDYIGVVQGVPICFDAKECHLDRFTLRNIHEHQMEFMKHFEEQDGIAFFLIYFTHVDEHYYVPYRDVARFWERGQKKGGKQSFLRQELDPAYRIDVTNQIYIHYLEPLSIDLESRE